VPRPIAPTRSTHGEFRNAAGDRVARMRVCTRVKGAAPPSSLGGVQRSRQLSPVALKHRGSQAGAKASDKTTARRGNAGMAAAFQGDGAGPPGHPYFIFGGRLCVGPQKSPRSV
jgi:hypothetical protein